MATITINGTTFQGKNIQVINNRVKVDEQIIEHFEGDKINIEILGNIDSILIDSSASVSINGDYYCAKTLIGTVSVSTMSGDIEYKI